MNPATWHGETMSQEILNEHGDRISKVEEKVGALDERVSEHGQILPVLVDNVKGLTKVVDRFDQLLIGSNEKPGMVVHVAQFAATRERIEKIVMAVVLAAAAAIGGYMVKHFTG